MTGGVHEHMRAWQPEEDLTILRLLGVSVPKVVSAQVGLASRSRYQARVPLSPPAGKHRPRRRRCSQ